MSVLWAKFDFTINKVSVLATFDFSIKMSVFWQHLIFAIKELGWIKCDGGLE